MKIIAQAQPLAMKRFIAAVKRSPTPYGHVSHVDIEPITDRNYKFFGVK
ncbi:hypothetical protein [Acetilactobacillus jinshanensis]|nr:hypothetical protein [Acetilactobacillus jinshanensis]